MTILEQNWKRDIPELAKDLKLPKPVCHVCKKEVRRDKCVIVVHMRNTDPSFIAHKSCAKAYSLIDTIENPVLIMEK